ncbi:N-acetylmuramoyl-L-alanine amidase [Prevotellamassilia timonensis]|uniref:N-acetylmuramoyl-L-alanine amidase n=1 Tax=Prevotellamassilia timonensis TaxID=1852370 RepID=UPI0023F0CF6F|nr:N-acetylmuramoyl-L-alanine amidase [Prevotellamassilia timonensis]MDD7440448.1 N-acetylmuramoyl-L-alanine amidase [Prevotellamassilia timonensis]
MPFVSLADVEKRNFTLVIDAGHGGHDAGAIGAYSKEKDINLKVALAFGRLVENNCPDVKVVYTRKTDVFIPLQRRADIANNNKADLFVSVHTNALPAGRQAYGSETYTLGMARANANLAVAKRENSVITLESDYKSTYQGFDPNKAESYVIFEFMQDKFMKQSVDLATCIQRQYASAGRPNKGVHQAGFLVLRNTSMPSVLTELGFITTPSEEAYLNSQQGVTELSRSIYNGFLAYRRMHQRGVNDIPANLPLQVAAANDVAQKPVNANGKDTPSAKEVAVVPVEAVPTARIAKSDADKNEEKPVTETRRPSQPKTRPVTAQAAPVRKVEEPAAKRTPAVANKPVATPKQSAASKQSAKPTPKQNAAAKSTAKDKDTDKAKGKQTASKKESPKETKGKDTKKEQVGARAKQRVTYRIQVGAGKKEIAANDPQFKGLDVTRVKEGTLYKYYYGTYHTYAEAQKAQKTVKAKLPAAYIVATVAGKSVTVAEARAKEKE